MKFIRLTSTNKDFVTVNPLQIAYFGKYYDTDTTLVVISNDISIKVRETPEEIWSLIKATENDLQRY